MFSIIRRSTLTSDGRGSRSMLVPRQEEKSAGVRETCATSACRKTAQKPGPPGNVPGAGSSTQTNGRERRSGATSARGMQTAEWSGSARSMGERLGGADQGGDPPDRVTRRREEAVHADEAVDLAGIGEVRDRHAC